MDLYAYMMIDKYSKLAEDNGIFVPRLRGYRLMAYEKPTGEDCYASQRFDSYCGRNDVLYVHARIGGNNWEDYCDEVMGDLIERVDDEFDNTYCDLYFKIKPVEVE